MQKYRTVAESTKAIKTRLKADLTKEDAEDIWQRLDSRVLENQGHLLAELFLACPMNIDGFESGYLARNILRYVSQSGSDFTPFIEHMPLTVFTLRTECKIPIELVRPLLSKVSDENLVQTLRNDPSLYSADIGDRVLGIVKTLKNPSYELRHNLIDKFPGFWEQYRSELFPMLFPITNLADFFDTIGSSLNLAEKVEVIKQALDKVQKPRDSESIQNLYKFVESYIPIGSRSEIESIFRAKVEELIKAEEVKDPVDAYLRGEMSWGEMTFAKTDPDGYKRFQASRKEFFNGKGGPPPWFDGPPSLFFRMYSRYGYG